ncbi:MAG: DUF5680 domain-containing protein [Anaerolineaceae bacterium]
MAGAFSTDLLRFIVRAKAATYVAGANANMPSCRPGSHDIRFTEGDFTYLDSYFGGADFIGEEVVFRGEEPLWAMNYYGRILNPQKITPAETGQMIQRSLTHMYRQGRFLGGFEYPYGDLVYHDTSDGEPDAFTGVEWITRGDEVVYRLVYHGGLIR